MSDDVLDLGPTLQLFERQTATGWATQQNGNRTNENHGVTITVNIAPHSPTIQPRRPKRPPREEPRRKIEREQPRQQNKSRPRNQSRSQPPSRPQSPSGAPQYRKPRTNAGEVDAEVVHNGHMESSPKIKPSAQQQHQGLQHSRWNQQDPRDGKEESKSHSQSVPTAQGPRQYSNRQRSKSSIEAENKTPEQAPSAPAVASVPQLTNGSTGAQLPKQYSSSSPGRKKMIATEPNKMPVPIPIPESLSQLGTGPYNPRRSSHLDERDRSTRVENNVPEQLMVPNTTSSMPVKVGPHSLRQVGMDPVDPEDRPWKDENTNPEQPTSSPLSSQHTTASRGVLHGRIDDDHGRWEGENNDVMQTITIEYLQEEIAPRDVWRLPDLPRESSESRNSKQEQSPPVNMPPSQPAIARLQPSEPYEPREPKDPRKSDRSRDRTETGKKSSDSGCCVIL